MKLRELNKGLLVRENRKRQKERQRKLVKPGPNDGKRGHKKWRKIQEYVQVPLASSHF